MSGPDLDDATMRGDVLETYRGLLEDLDRSHGMVGRVESSIRFSLFGRAADAIRRLAAAVARLRHELEYGPDVRPCPACGPGTAISIEGPVGARHVGCGACGLRGPRSNCGCAYMAWNALPRRGDGSPAVGGDSGGVRR